MPALVAKSFQDLEQVSEIYEVDGKQYVKVRMNNGTIKTVRAYTEKEYSRYMARQNGEVKIVSPGKPKSEIFGFGDANFIYIFIGDTYANLDWFKWSPCRYARMFGWYLPSAEPMPDPLPEGISYVKLYWDQVCSDDGFNVKPEAQVIQIVDKLRFPPDPSQHIGNYGDKVDLMLTCTKVTPLDNNGYSMMYLHIFRDADQNCFIWTTASKTLTPGESYHIKGTVVGHNTYHNCAQTVLKYCRVQED